MVQVHANLSGDSAAGTFSGLLVKGGVPDRWQLTWKLSLPSLRGPMSASLEVGATRVLCRRCTRGANGAMRLTATQARRITRDDAVVVVKTPSVTLRGPVKAFLHAPVPVS